MHRYLFVDLTPLAVDLSPSVLLPPQLLGIPVVINFKNSNPLMRTKDKVSEYAARKQKTPAADGQFFCSGQCFSCLQFPYLRIIGNYCVGSMVLFFKRRKACLTRPVMLGRSADGV